MNLLLLAPDIQEQILFLSPTNRGRDPIGLAQLQPIARALDWNQQRRLWTGLRDLAIGAFTDLEQVHDGTMRLYR